MILKDFRAVFLPYCIEKQENDKYAVLNRYYKPLGFNTKTLIDYKKYPVLVNLKITKSILKKLTGTQQTDTDKIYLYDDKTNPSRSAKNMNIYLEKLKVLAKIIIK